MPVAIQLPPKNYFLRRLYLPAYTVAEAARYASANRRTVSYWHYRHGAAEPVLPGKDRGSPLSYLQLVEVAFVATFRSLGVTLPRIRKARDYLAKTFDLEYPFATVQLKTQGANVLLDMLTIEPDSELRRLVFADRAGQLSWQELVGDRFFQFDYFEGLALRWHPRGRQSPVVVDARISFGAPTVRGIPTYAIAGRASRGVSLEDIGADFHLRQEDILAALTFEGIDLAA